MCHHYLILSHGETVQCGASALYDEIARIMDEGASGLSVWFVPLSVRAAYGIRDYRPDVAGSHLLFVKGA